MSDRLTSLRNSAEFAEERLVARAQALLHECMIERGLNKTDLADKMGVTKARVSQIFSDNQNFTFRLVASAFHALGKQITLDLLREENNEQQIETKSYPASREYLISDLIEYVLADEMVPEWKPEQIIEPTHARLHKSWELHSELKNKVENLHLSEQGRSRLNQHDMSTWADSNVISIDKKRQSYASAR
jgi:transcriptional regulator with XRE-family HTH domain